VDLIKHLGIRIEDKRIPSPINGNHPRVYPTDDCFDDPYSFLELVKRIGEFGSVESNTLKTIGKIVHGLNAKKLGDQIYTEIASCLNK